MSVFSVAVLQKGNTGNLICLASITKLYHQPANGHSWVEDWGWLTKNWITLFSTVHCQNSLHHQQHSEVVGNIVPACHTVPTAWEKAGVVKARKERDSFSRRYRAWHAEMSARLLEGLLWYGSSLSLLMNPAGPDLATISQLHRTAQNPLLMKGEQMSSKKSATAAH